MAQQTTPFSFKGLMNNTTAVMSLATMSSSFSSAGFIVDNVIFCNLSSTTPVQVDLRIGSGTSTSYSVMAPYILAPTETWVFENTVKVELLETVSSAHSVASLVTMTIDGAKVS